MVKIKSKVKTKKITKKPLPKLFGKSIVNPGPWYGGGALHYLNKEGKIIHDSKRSVSECKKDTMTKTEFNKRYDSSEVKKKNPSTKSIRNNIRAIEKMEDDLLVWNLKYDEFPDIKEYVNKNWELSFGKKEALALLNAAARKRSDSYWNTRTNYAADEYHDTRQAWWKIITKLKGTEKLPEVKAKIKEKPYVEDLRTKEDIDNWKEYPPISLDDFDF
jgi:hypothetical protein